MKDVFTILLNIAKRIKSSFTRLTTLETWQSGVADYVVEYGTNGIWHYEKRASGVAICWGRYEFSATTSTSVNVNGYLPSGIMDTTSQKEIFASGRFNGVPNSYIGYTTCSVAGRYDVYIYRTTTNSVAGAIAMEIRGTWK